MVFYLLFESFKVMRNIIEEIFIKFFLNFMYNELKIFFNSSWIRSSPFVTLVTSKRLFQVYERMFYSGKNWICSWVLKEIINLRQDEGRSDLGNFFKKLLCVGFLITCRLKKLRVQTKVLVFEVWFSVLKYTFHILNY